MVKSLFVDSFVLYRPKDIVSGDFYWFKESGNKAMFAAIDCTGHGVPGAFVSLVGHNVLNQVTKVFTKPSQVLNNLNRLSYEALNSEVDEMAVRDGMDLALCTLDKESYVLEFAGAHSPVFVIRDKVLLQYEPDKFSIGSFAFGEREYQNQRVQLEEGDSVYVFSDGFVDQFGGPRGKKFLKKRFKELLLELSHLSMEDQKKKLQASLDEWQGNLEQVDDILVIGIRV
jgi:serine phosphatase RsbU (regulator of sigma subunit)